MEVHSRNQEASKLNTFVAGFAIAILVPLIIFVGYWYIKVYPCVGLINYISQIKFSGFIASLAVCALPDPLIFWYFNSKKYYDKACKGMLAVIILLLVITIILKIV